MGFFKWLYRLPGRLNRSIEKTALASSVVRGEGMDGTQFNLTSVNLALSEIERSGTREDDSATAKDE
jgi:hypothetical protein